MALTSIGGISVKIKADMQGFRADLNRASNMVSKSAKRMRQSGNEFGKWAAAGTAAAAAVGAAMVRSQMQTIDALAKTADRLGLTTQALAGLQRSAELSGASTETLNMALQRMTRRVAEAAQGTGEAKNAIKELGLDAQALAAMSPDQQFKTIADAMGGVAEQGDRVRLSMKLFDSEGVKLLNTLQMGSEALEQQEQIAIKLGTALSRVDAAKVENANDAMSTAGDALEGIINRVTVQLAPIIEALADSFVDASVEAEGFGDTIDKVVTGAIKVIGFFGDAWRGIEVIVKTLELGLTSFRAAWLESMRIMTVGMEQFVNLGISGINKLIEAANMMPGVSIPAIEKFTFSAAGMFTRLADEAGADLTRLKGELHELAMKKLPSQTMEEWVASIKAKAQEVAEAMANSQGGGEGKGGVNPIEQEALDARIEAIRQNLMTEQQLKAEAFNADIEAIKAKRELDLENAAMYNQMEKDLAQQHANELVSIAQDAADKEARIEELKQQAKINAISSAFSNASALMNTESRKLFKVGKMAAIAEATVTGINAAVTNFKKGSDIGGPPLGAAFAAASLAATGAQIQQIKSTQFGSAGAGQSIQGGQVVNNTGGAGVSPTQSISINLAGSANYTAGDIRGLIDAINDQTGDGYQLNVTGG